MSHLWYVSMNKYTSSKHSKSKCSFALTLTVQVTFTPLLNALKKVLSGVQIVSRRKLGLNGQKKRSVMIKGMNVDILTMCFESV